MRLIRLTLVPALLWAASGMAQQQLPEGPGKATTLQICSKCHPPEIIVGQRQGRDEWMGTIQQMIDSGAEGTEDQFNQVLEYLTKYFGPGAPQTVNVNKAPAADLQSGLGLTETEAAAIVKHRTDKGAFKTIEDLKKVPGLDFKKIAAQKDRLTF